MPVQFKLVLLPEPVLLPTKVGMLINDHGQIRIIYDEYNVLKKIHT